MRLLMTLHMIRNMLCELSVSLEQSVLKLALSHESEVQRPKPVFSQGQNPNY